jgi:hypothetical protein
MFSLVKTLGPNEWEIWLVRCAILRVRVLFALGLQNEVYTMPTKGLQGQQSLDQGASPGCL